MDLRDWPEFAVKEAAEVINQIVEENPQIVGISESAVNEYTLEYWSMKLKWFVETAVVSIGAIIFGVLIAKADFDFFRFTRLQKGLCLLCDILLFRHYCMMLEWRHKIETVKIFEKVMQKMPNHIVIDDGSNEEKEEESNERN